MRFDMLKKTTGVIVAAAMLCVSSSAYVTAAEPVANEGSIQAAETVNEPVANEESIQAAETVNEPVANAGKVTSGKSDGMDPDSQNTNAESASESDLKGEADTSDVLETDEETLLASENSPIYAFKGIYTEDYSRFSSDKVKTGVRFLWSQKVDVSEVSYYIYASNTQNGSYTQVAAVSNEYNDLDFYRYSMELDSSGEPIGIWDFEFEWDGRGNANVSSGSYRYYKIQAVVNGSVIAEKTMDMGSSENFFDGDVSNAKTGYTDIAFVDDAGNRIYELVLHEGETKKINIAMYKDGRYQMLHGMKVNDEASYNNPYMDDLALGGMGSGMSFSVSWMAEHNACNGSNAVYGGSNDYYVKGLFTEESIAGLSQYIKGVRANTSGNVLVGVAMGGDMGTLFGRQCVYLPVKILPAESGVSYTEPKQYSLTNYTNGGVIATRESEIYALIRKGLVERRMAFALYSDPSFSLNLDTLYDMYRERAGMKPNEGDYLKYAMGDKEDSYSVGGGLYTRLDSDTRFYFAGSYNTYYAQAVDGEFGMITTAEQEAFVDSKIKQLLSSGGALYSVNNDSATDEQKISAAYNYVVQNVRSTPDSYGRTKPYYHTVCCALKDGHGTCEAYALLFERLMRELGVPCRVMMGVDSAAHGYNIVRNGQYWYFIDTSTGRYLTDEPSFARAEEQKQFSDQRFINNYLSKLKNSRYQAQAVANFTVDVYENGVYINTISIDTGDVEGLAACISAICDDSEDDTYNSRKYVINMNNGNCIIAGIPSGLVWGYGNYGLPDRVTLDLCGNTLQFNNGASCSLSFSEIKNGKATFGSGAMVIFDAASLESMKISQVDFSYKESGDNIQTPFEYVMFIGNAIVDSRCSINGLKTVGVEGTYGPCKPHLYCDVNAEKLIIYNEGGDFENVVVNTLTNFSSGGNIDKYSTFGNLTVNGMFTEGTDGTIVIKDSASINGGIQYSNQPNDNNACRSTGLLILAAQKSDGSYPSIKIKGTLDTRARAVDINWNPTTNISSETLLWQEFLTVKLGRGKFVDGVFETQTMPADTSLATIENLWAYPSLDATSASDRVGAENISKYFEMVEECKSSQSAGVKLDGNTIKTIKVALSDADASFVGSSLSLDGSIGLNLYVKLSSALASDSTTLVSIVDKNGNVLSSLKPVNATPESDGTYKVGVSVPAKEMTDAYTLKVTSGGKTYIEDKYSVKDYADFIIANENKDYMYRAAAPVMRAMLNYGGYAQKYFDYRTTDLANAGLYTSSNDPVNSVSITLDDVVMQHFSDDFSTKKNSGLGYVGASFVCNSEMGVNFYFTPRVQDSTISQILAGMNKATTLDGTAVTSNVSDSEKNGLYVRKISNIAPADLDKEIVVTLTNKSNQNDLIKLYYTPTYYLWKASTGSDEKLADLSKAIYLYHKAAKTFFEP